MSPLRPLLLLCALAFAACSYAPRQDVRPEPLFIRAGIEPGDRVELVTRDGRSLAFEVTEVEDDALVGDGLRVAFADIETLSKRAWEPPANPCGGGKPVGCSLPEVLVLASDYYERYAERFRAACARHDYCYRHGYATYGMDRYRCDLDFHDDMKQECEPEGILEMLDPDSVKDQAECLITAEQLFQGVRRYGEKAFLTTTSTNCPYDGAR